MDANLSLGAMEFTVSAGEHLRRQFHSVGWYTASLGRTTFYPLDDYGRAELKFVNRSYAFSVLVAHESNKSPHLSWVDTPFVPPKRSSVK